MTNTLYVKDYLVNNYEELTKIEELGITKENLLDFFRAKLKENENFISLDYAPYETDSNGDETDAINWNALELDMLIFDERYGEAQACIYQLFEYYAINVSYYISDIEIYKQGTYNRAGILLILK